MLQTISVCNRVYSRHSHLPTTQSRQPHHIPVPCNHLPVAGACNLTFFMLIIVSLTYLTPWLYSLPPCCLHVTLPSLTVDHHTWLVQPYIYLIPRHHVPCLTLIPLVFILTHCFNLTQWLLPRGIYVIRAAKKAHEVVEDAFCQTQNLHTKYIPVARKLMAYSQLTLGETFICIRSWNPLKKERVRDIDTFPEHVFLLCNCIF